MLWQDWAGRGVWKALLAVGLAVATFQMYKRWRQRRALSRLAGKVVLITGASSGLGEGDFTNFVRGRDVGVLIASSTHMQLLQDYSTMWVQRSFWHHVMCRSCKL